MLGMGVAVGTLVILLDKEIFCIYSLTAISSVARMQKLPSMVPFYRSGLRS